MQIGRARPAICLRQRQLREVWIPTWPQSVARALALACKRGAGLNECQEGHRQLALDVGTAPGGVCLALQDLAFCDIECSRLPVRWIWRADGPSLGSGARSERSGSSRAVQLRLGSARAAHRRSDILAGARQ